MFFLLIEKHIFIIKNMEYIGYLIKASDHLLCIL